MMKNRKCQIMMVGIMATLLYVAPQVSTALRPKYLYFIFNILIIALVAEAGLLPSLSTPFFHQNHTNNHHFITNTNNTVTTADDHHEETGNIAEDAVQSKRVDKFSPIAEDAVQSKRVDKFSPKKIKKSLVVVKVLVDKIVETCPIVLLPIPSLFFIGGNTVTATADEDSSNSEQELHHDQEKADSKLREEEEEAVEERRSGLELFTKAEMFIGNFYNQLKMQRDSIARAEETYS